MAILTNALTSGLGGNLVNIAFWGGIFLVGGGILTAIVYWVLIQMQFKYNVTIWEEMNDGGTKEHIDKGRIINRKDGTTIFKLKRFKLAKIPVPPNRSFMIGAGGKNKVYLRKYGTNDYDFVPVGVYLKGLDINLQPFSHERKNWIATELKRSQQRHGSWWDQYGQMVIAIGFSVFMLIGFILIFQMFREIVSAMQGPLGQLPDAIREAGASLSNVCSPAVPSGPPPGV